MLVNKAPKTKPNNKLMVKILCASGFLFLPKLIENAVAPPIPINIPKEINILKIGNEIFNAVKPLTPIPRPMNIVSIKIYNDKPIIDDIQGTKNLKNNFSGLSLKMSIKKSKFLPLETKPFFSLRYNF